MYVQFGVAAFRPAMLREFTAAIGLLFVASLAILALSVVAQDTNIPIRIIVVESADEAQRIMAALRSGRDFGTIAREKSIDPTASDGGFMGVLDPAALRPELQEALRNLHPGELSAITKIPSGYAILQIVKETGEAAAPPDRGPTGLAYSFMPTSAASTIRLIPSVSGMNEEWVLMNSFPKPPNWNQDLQQICEVRKQANAEAQQRMLDAVASVDKGDLKLEPKVEEDLHYTLAEVWSYYGEMAKAIAEWERAYEIATASYPEMVPQLEETLGVAYLHKSGMDNDVFRHPGDRCFLPLPKYAKTESSEKAVRYFLKYLQNDPGSIEVKWLLNLAYMTLGKYPQEVPRQYLISPDHFRSTENVGRFVDVAPQAGLDIFTAAGGIIVDDFDNDGLLDVVTSSWDDCAPMHFFHNNGDGTFTDRTVQAGLAGQLGGLNIIQTDYNNDGCIDILVLRGAFELPKRKSLLRNNCDGTFTDVTKQAGLAEPATSTQTAVWTDINNDGYLDLFVGNENAPAQLFLNKGDGTFVDIAHSAGVDRTAWSKAVVAADYDNDGYPDLYVSNAGGEAFLYHNNRDLTFTEVSKQAGVKQPVYSFPAWFFDYDNDGLPDLFIASYYPSLEETVSSFLQLPTKGETLKLYKNLGNGKFKDVTKETHLDRIFMPMGSNFGDIDNDGFLDIYLGTGNPSYASMSPHALLHNVGGKYFTDISISSGTDEIHNGHGVAFADLGNNGEEDLIEEMGGAVPGDKHALRLWKNPGNDNDWISVHLVGVKTNRPAIGARIKVTVKNEDNVPRDIYRTVGSGGSFGASPFQQHIGLGKSARIENIEVWWPASNTRQNFPNVTTNQFIDIKEFAKDYTKLARHGFTLGGVRSTAATTNIRSQPNPSN